jgi:hypothetical protein
MPALRRTPRVGCVLRIEVGARQMIAVILSLTESNENSLERRSVAYRSFRNKSTLYNFFQLALE